MTDLKRSDGLSGGGEHASWSRLSEKQHIAVGLVEPEFDVQIPHSAQVGGRVMRAACEQSFLVQISGDHKAGDGIEQAVLVSELPVDGRWLNSRRGGDRTRGHGVDAAALQQVSARPAPFAPSAMPSSSPLLSCFR